MIDALLLNAAKAYADVDGLTQEECNTLTQDTKQAEALLEAFADGDITQNELNRFRSLGIEISNQMASALSNDSKLFLRERANNLIGILQTGSNEQRERVGKALSEIGPHAIPRLVELFKNEDEQVRKHAVKVIARMGSGAVPALIAGLEDTNDRVRVHAMQALGKMGPVAKDAIPALIKLLRYVSPESNSAIIALSKIGAPAVPALIEAVKSLQRVTTLPEYHGIVPGPLMISEGMSVEQVTGAFALEALAQMGSVAKPALPILTSLLQHPNSNLRYSVADAISKIDPDTAKRIPAKYYIETRSKEDNDVVEKTIGKQDAALLWERFGINRFGRYHPSILKHLVEMAKDVNHDRDKPLVLALVANYDDSGWFYWGKHFEHDPRIRLIVIEAHTRDELKEKAWALRNSYGIPDTLMITAHGLWDRIAVGYVEIANGWLSNGDLAADYKGFFGNKKGQVVLNACDVGAPPPAGKENFAQMTARAFGAETVAPRAKEGLLSLSVKITAEGLARLVPTYFELGGDDFFGVNHGGMTFYPGQTPIYRRVADANNSWQPSVALSRSNGAWHLGGGVGYSHKLLDHLRFRYDLLADVDAIKRDSVRVALNPEMAAGFSNHFMFATGMMVGAEFALGGNAQRSRQTVMQHYSALRFVLPSANMEFDVGYADTVEPGKGISPSLFLRSQGRFNLF